MKKRICLIFGGRSSEYEVSLASAYEILDGMDHQKYEVSLIGITKKGIWYLYEGDPKKIKSSEWENDTKNLTCAYICPSYRDCHICTDDGRKIKIDIVFPAVHGENCEDGRLQGFLELSGIPFVGPGSLASSVCMDKSLTKALISLKNIPTAPYFTVTVADKETNFSEILRKAKSLGYPLFVKPTSQGSSVGASKVLSEDELSASLDEALACGERALVEKYIAGKEIEVAVLGNEYPTVSVCGEIDPGADFYDYDTKYKKSSASYKIPADISEEVSKKVRIYAENIYKSLYCRGLSRVDFFVTEKGEIFFNEINTLPGFTKISMYPKLMMNEGITFSELISSLIELAK